ncbi:MAG: ammonia-forming cytochrome c nitrite reductase subunit c552, partial [Chloroflexi bacterium]|nr:ammonia-forming cytochrome c nitrite reductase subunit c552 [Chloroflexota bacterium]
AGCHTTGYDVTLKEWSEPGVTCESCHGPGQNHVLSTDKANDPQIFAKSDPEVCGSCHTRGKTKDDQWSWPEGYVPGGSVRLDDIYDVTTSATKWWFDNPDDATDPYHAKSHHQQYPEWKASRHSSALENIRNLPFTQDFCLGCHSQDYRDDPTNVTKETAEFGITCQTCHATHDNGFENVPLTAQAIDGSQLVKPAYELCTECHNASLSAGEKFTPGANVHHPMKEMFEGTGFPGLADIPSPHFQADDGATCTSCHMPKTAKSAVPGDITSHRFAVAMPGDVKEGEPDSCTGCHTSADRDGLQKLIDDRQATVKDELAKLKQLGADSACGDFDSGAPADGASDACKTAFTGYKMVHEEGSFGIHNYYYAKAVLKASIEALSGQVYDKPYVGSTTCAVCHGNKYNSLQETLHPWKVRPKAEATIVGQFPVVMDGVTYTLDDVDWVIGAHPKWKQRYIHIDDGVWHILPIQWNIAPTQGWVPYSHAGDYRDGCAGCHTTGYDVTLKEWSEPGVTCESCHGPGQAQHRQGQRSQDLQVVGFGSLWFLPHPRQDQRRPVELARGLRARGQRAPGRHLRCDYVDDEMVV